MIKEFTLDGNLKGYKIIMCEEEEAKSALGVVDQA
jgi:hypothetical protein